MLALLDHHKLGAHRPHRVARPHQVFVFGKQLRLGVVEHQAIDPLEQFLKLVTLNIDPEVHCVGHGQRRVGHLIEHRKLRDGRCVAQKHKLALAMTVGELWLELAKHIQVHLKGFAVVHVGHVATPPAERLAAGNRLEAAGVDAPLLEKGRVLRRKVVADGADHPHR